MLHNRLLKWFPIINAEKFCVWVLRGILTHMGFVHCLQARQNRVLGYRMPGQCCWAMNLQWFIFLYQRYSCEYYSLDSHRCNERVEIYDVSRGTGDDLAQLTFTHMIFSMASQKAMTKWRFSLPRGYGFRKGLKLRHNSLCIVVIMKLKLNDCIYFKILPAI